MNYLERLNLLNDKSDTVWNSIDKPLRRLIFEMNRVGFITKFSCFGMPYGEDDEPKTHANNCYIHFYVTEDSFDVLNKLTAQKELTRYIKLYNFMDVMVLQFIDSLPEDYYDNSDGISIHKYEQYVISITSITYFLQELPGKDEVTIYDGNAMYSNIELWQIDAKPNFTISSNDFYTQYGKIKHPQEAFNAFKEEQQIVYVSIKSEANK